LRILQTKSHLSTACHFVPVQIEQPVNGEIFEVVVAVARGEHEIRVPFGLAKAQIGSPHVSNLCIEPQQSSGARLVAAFDYFAVLRWERAIYDLRIHSRGVDREIKSSHRPGRPWHEHLKKTHKDATQQPCFAFGPDQERFE
jgi:hypothetical protein